ncbi:hypothetical protein AB3S75_017597 [Citrus x aurantiifolia]
MLVPFGTRVRLPKILNCRHHHRLNFAETLKMAATDAKSKRPICPSCSKPTRLCLCNRIHDPGLENSVSVTILRHSLERNHPLNSTRIAKLGLKNVTVATVFDVNFEARFDIRLTESCQESLDDGFGLKGENVVGLKCKKFKKGFEEEDGCLIDVNKDCCLRNDMSGMLDANSYLKGSNVVNDFDGLVSVQETEGNGENGTFASETRYCRLFRKSYLGHKAISYGGYGDPTIAVTISKYGIISGLVCNWVLTDCQKPNFDQIVGSQVALDALEKGFVVKKMGKRELDGNMESEEYEEYKLEVSPGSVLLFPSENAVGVDDLKAMNFEVKNLIVLDGTWSKAKRMYKENPWLKLLPHLKLDLDKMSLYSEVRHQPKAGYLSTIESIVYTLMALGDNTERLNNLLDVFESMVGDQRRCKDERLSKASHCETYN